MRPQLLLTGDKALDANLRALPLKLQKKGVRKATRSSAKMVLADAERDVAHETGRLEKSLTVRTAKGARGKRLRKGTTGHAVATREGMFSGETFYGGFIEYGTAERVTKAGASRGRVDESSFLRRNLYGNARAVKATFRNDLLQAIREIAREAKK